MLGHHRHASETFRWRADDIPLILAFGSSLPSQTKDEKKNVVKVGPTLTKLSGYAHVRNAVELRFAGGIVVRFCMLRPGTRSLNGQFTS